MNLAAIRARAERVVAVPGPDGNFYSDVAQAVHDRAELLAEVDRRPDLSSHDLMTMRLVLDDSISDLRDKITRAVEDAQTTGDYTQDDIDWMKVRLASQERLMDRLNNL